MTLRIRVLRTLEECSPIQDDWARLVRMEGGGILGFDVTATSVWTAAIWRGMLGGSPQTVLVAEDDSGVRGLLPCSISPENIGNVPHYKLTAIGSIYELRTGFLVGGDAAVLDALLEYALKKLKGWDTFIFRVVDGSPSDLAIREVMRKRNIQVEVWKDWVSPYFHLPSDPALVLSSLKSKLRSNVRRLDKTLQQLGKLEARFYDTADSVPGFIDLMDVIEQRSWKLAAGTAMTTNPKQKMLYSVVTPAVARIGCFLGAALMLNDQPIAYIYGYAFAGVFVDEKESYDDQYKEHGPGNVLKAKFLEELVRRGIGTYDYGGVAEPHKAQWTNLTYSRHIYIIYNNTVRGWLVRSSLRVRKWVAGLRRPQSSSLMT